MCSVQCENIVTDDGVHFERSSEESDSEDGENCYG